VPFKWKYSILSAGEVNMPLQGPRIKISKSWIEQFCKTHHIVKLALFGSVLTDDFSAESDVDILVEFDPNHIPGFFGVVEMREELSLNIGQEVDLRTPEDIGALSRKNLIQQSYLLYSACTT